MFSLRVFLLLMVVSAITASQGMEGGRSLSRLKRGEGDPPAPHIPRPKFLHNIVNGYAICGNNFCQVWCTRGFTFIRPDIQHLRRVSLLWNFSTGQFYLRNQVWTPNMTICAPDCEPTCENGSTCVAPNKCQASSLPVQQHTVECEPGSRMPDGSTSVTLSFRDNSWFFPDGSMMDGLRQVRCRKDDEV